MDYENFRRDLAVMLDVDHEAAAKGFRDLLDSLDLWHRGVALEREQRLAAINALTDLATPNRAVAQPAPSQDNRSPSALRQAFEEAWTSGRDHERLRDLHLVICEEFVQAQSEHLRELQLAGDLRGEVLAAANADSAVRDAVVALADVDASVRAMLPDQLRGTCDVYHLQTHGHLPLSPELDIAIAHNGGLAAHERGLTKAAAAEHHKLKAAVDRRAALELTRLMDKIGARCGLNPADLLTEARNNAKGNWESAPVDTYERVRGPSFGTYPPAPQVVDYGDVAALPAGGVSACMAMLRLDSAADLAVQIQKEADQDVGDVALAAVLMLESPDVRTELTRQLRSEEVLPRELAALAYTGLDQTLRPDVRRDYIRNSDYPAQILLGNDTASLDGIAAELTFARDAVLPTYQTAAAHAVGRETAAVQGLAAWEHERGGVLASIRQHLHEISAHVLPTQSEMLEKASAAMEKMLRKTLVAPPAHLNKTSGDVAAGLTRMIGRAQELANLAGEADEFPQAPTEASTLNNDQLLTRSKNRMAPGADRARTIVPTAARLSAEIAFLEATRTQVTPENTAAGAGLDAQMVLLAKLIRRDPALTDQLRVWVGTGQHATSQHGPVVLFVSELARPGEADNIALAREAASENAAVEYFLQDQNLLGRDDGTAGGLAIIDPDGKPPAMSPASRVADGQPATYAPPNPKRPDETRALPLQESDDSRPLPSGQDDIIAASANSEDGERPTAGQAHTAPNPPRPGGTPGPSGGAESPVMPATTSVTQLFGDTASAKRGQAAAPSGGSRVRERSRGAGGRVTNETVRPGEVASQGGLSQPELGGDQGTGSSPLDVNSGMPQESEQRDNSGHGTEIA